MELRQEIDSNYHQSFCSGGFFWGHQFQEEAMKEYKEQRQSFLRLGFGTIRKRRRSNLFLLVVKKELD
jgi:hypothetical protein